jgi:hypothetical protein
VESIIELAILFDSIFIVTNFLSVPLKLIFGDRCVVLGVLVHVA